MIAHCPAPKYISDIMLTVSTYSKISKRPAIQTLTPSTRRARRATPSNWMLKARGGGSRRSAAKAANRPRALAHIRRGKIGISSYPIKLRLIWRTAGQIGLKFCTGVRGTSNMTEEIFQIFPASSLVLISEKLLVWRHVIARSNDHLCSTRRYVILLAAWHINGFSRMDSFDNTFSNGRGFLPRPNVNHHIYI